MHTNSIVFQDYPDGTSFTNTWSWTATALNPFATNGTLSVRGFGARLVHSSIANIAGSVVNVAANGNFLANAAAFTNWPGYLGAPNPSPDSRLDGLGRPGKKASMARRRGRASGLRSVRAAAPVTPSFSCRAEAVFWASI